MEGMKMTKRQVAGLRRVQRSQSPLRTNAWLLLLLGLLYIIYLMLSSGGLLSGCAGFAAFLMGMIFNEIHTRWTNAS